MTRDGKKVTRVSSRPVRWKDRSGTWKRIDPQLRTESAGTHEAAAVADGRVRLPATPDADGVVEVGDGRGARISLRLENAAPRRSVAARDRQAREYREVQRGVTQRMTVTPTGMKEELVLRDPRSPQRFSYRLKLSNGLVPVVQPNGSINVLRGTSTVFQIPRAVLYELRTPANKAAGAPYRLTRLGDGDWRLHVDGNESWMRDPSRSWPVVVDPTVVIYRLAVTGLCRWDLMWADDLDACGQMSGFPPETMRVGWDSRGGISDPMTGHAMDLQFDLPGAVSSSPLLEAKLKLHVTGSTNTSGLSQEVRVTGHMTETPTTCSLPWEYLGPCLPWYYKLDATQPVGAVPGELTFEVAEEIERWFADPPPYPVTMGSFRLNMKGQPSWVLGTPMMEGAICNSWDYQYWTGWNDGMDSPSDPSAVCDQNFVDVATDFHSDDAKHPYLDVVTTSRAQLGSEVEAPVEGKLTSRFVELRAKAASENVTSARFQYIAGSRRDWRTIPLEALKFKTTGAEPGSNDITVTDGRSTRLIWDLDRTLGGEVDGPVQVRAILDAGSAGGGGVTPVRNFRLDRKNPETASSEQVGPAEVDLMTGDVAISETDVDVPAFIDDLQLTRTYHSRGGTPRTNDMFGPGWTGSFEVDGGEMPYRGIYNFTDIKEDEQIVDWMIDDSLVDYEYFDPMDLQFIPVKELKRFETHYAVLEKADGSKITFRQDGANWVVDAENPNLKVEKTTAGFTVKDAEGGVTEFQPEAVGSPNYRPTSYQQAGSDRNTTFSYETVSGRLRLKRILAPSLPGITCTGTPLPAGCRALELEWGNVTVGFKTERRVKKVWLLAVDPSGADSATSRVVAEYEYDTTGRLKKVSDPRTSSGLPTEYAYDGEGRLTTYTPPEERPWTFAYQAIDGDSGTGRVRSVTRKTPAGTDATTTFIFNVPISGAGAPHDLSPSAVVTWGQSDRPQVGTAVFPPDAVPSGTGLPSSWERATVHYLGAHGKAVNVADAEGHIATSEYDERGNVVRELTPRNRERALASGSSVARSQLLDTQHTYADNGVDLLRTFGPEREVRQKDGSTALVRKYVTTTYDEGKPSTLTGDQHLPTEIRVGGFRTSDSYVIDEEVTRHYYGGPGNRGWAMKKPYQTTVGTGTGAATTTYGLHQAYPLVLWKQMPKSAWNDPGTTVYTYYGLTTPAVSTPPAWCRDGAAGLSNAAAAGGLLCSAAPAAQPTSGPHLAGSYFRYSLLWGEIEKRDATSAANAASSPLRVTTTGRDVLGRETSRAVTATTGRAVPTVTTSYSTTTGRVLTSTSAAIGSDPARTITRSWDDNGRLASYTDADGGVTSYTYDLSGRVSAVQDPRGTRGLSYDDRDLVTGVVDSELPGPITAERDADGNVIEQVLPGGPKAATTYDAAGDPVGLEWEATGGCSGAACLLASSTATRDAQGRIVGNESEQSTRNYTYDVLGRLNREDDERGGVCVRRQFAYDKNFNRAGQQRRESASSGACGSGTLTTKTSTYDGSDRITTSGYTYDALGRTLTVPAVDSPSGATTLTYDVDDLAASIVTDAYEQTVGRDPMRRLRTDTTKAPVSGPGSATTTAVLRYGDDDDAPIGRTGTWGWERYVGDVDDAEVAVVDDDGDVTWQLTDLHGDVVATVEGGSSTAAGESEYEAFGALAFSDGTWTPSEALGLTLGWLGSYGKRSPVTPGGYVHMGARVYNPVSGRFLQVDPIEGGSANAYDYAAQSPFVYHDLDGRFLKKLKKKAKAVAAWGGRRIKGAVHYGTKWAGYGAYAGAGVGAAAGYEGLPSPQSRAAGAAAGSAVGGVAGAFAGTVRGFIGGKK